MKKFLKGYMMLHAAKANGTLIRKEVRLITAKAGALSFILIYLIQLFQSNNQIEAIIKKLGPQVFNSENCRSKVIEAIEEVYWADDELCTTEQRHFFTMLRFFGNGGNRITIDI